MMQLFVLMFSVQFFVKKPSHLLHVSIDFFLFSEIKSIPGEMKSTPILLVGSMHA